MPLMRFEYRPKEQLEQVSSEQSFLFILILMEDIKKYVSKLGKKRIIDEYIRLHTSWGFCPYACWSFGW